MDLDHNLHTISDIDNSKYDICLSIDIDNLSEYIKKNSKQLGSKKIEQVGNYIKIFCNAINKKEDYLHKWNVYHGHGDEFTIFIGDKRLNGKNIHNYDILRIRSKYSLWLIEHIIKECNISITIGISRYFTFSDDALSTAKAYNNRGIVSMFYNYKEQHVFQKKNEKWVHIAFFANNEREVDIVCDQVYKEMIYTKDRFKISVKSREILN